MDPESLERDNDRSVDQLGEKTALLKNLTKGIHEEVETHNRMLERLVRARAPFQPSVPTEIASSPIHANPLCLCIPRGRART